jgi:hypothetical protein
MSVRVMPHPWEYSAKFDFESLRSYYRLLDHVRLLLTISEQIFRSDAQTQSTRRKIEFSYRPSSLSELAPR